MTTPAGLLDSAEVMVGNDAGWLLSFCNSEGEILTEIGRDDYFAEINATLNSGLEGGEYSFVVEGLTNEHYSKIKQNNEGAEKAVYVDLFLFWRDTASSVVGYLKNLAGLTDMLAGVKSEQLSEFLVARLSVSAVKRKKGDRRYVAEISAKERPFKLAKARNVCGEVSTEQPLRVARQLAEEAGIEVVAHDLPALAAGDSQPEAVQLCRPERGRSTHDTLVHLAGRMARSVNQHGRGMLLIRDGKLHIGYRPIPLNGEDRSIPLTTATGLITSKPLQSLSTDPNFDPCLNDADSAPKRKQFELILKGRGDIKPGDTVEFMPPKEDLDKAGGHWGGALVDVFSGPILPGLGDDELGEGKKTLYVQSINHKLGRSSGFVTTLTGVEVELPDDIWDQHSRTSAPEAPGDDPQDTTPAARAARAHRRLIRREFHARSFTEVAEVRAMNVSGTQEPPAQTLTLWRGLTDSDGGSNQTRRMPIQRPSDAVAEGAPYLTSFAWGKCGHVLPRYPGTRVAVTHRHAQRGEPMDMGSFWKSGEAPESQPGDWWLILPAWESDNGEERRSASGDDAVPPYDGNASNDLIDAKGNRVMEVAGFTLRFGSDHLNAAGERPTLAEDDALTIERGNQSASIVIKANGEIELKGSKITLDAGSGDVVLKGGAVKVE